MKIMLLIPAYNPADELIEYLRSLLSPQIGQIVVIDDGSGAAFQPVFSAIRQMESCMVLTHDRNIGKGAAIKTGFRYFLSLPDQAEYDAVVVSDMNGQHRLADILAVAHQINGEPAIWIGVRDFAGIPMADKVSNRMTRTLFRHKSHETVTDAWSGLRGFPPALISELSEIKGQRYEYEVNMLLYCSLHDISICELPIHSVYNTKNADPHFSPIWDNFLIFRLFFGTFFRYIFSSFGSYLLDLILFYLLIHTLFSTKTQGIFLSTITARVVSSSCNYLINRHLVFSSKGHAASQTLKYLLMVIFQMCCSAALVSLCSGLLHVPPTPCKVIVDVILFFLFYQVQKQFVFR